MVRSFPDKQPYEEFFVVFNFYRLLSRTNDSIATVAELKAFDADGVDQTTSFIDAGEQVIATPRVFAWVKGGTPQRYRLVCKITTTGGKKWQMVGYLTVVEGIT